MAQPSEGIAGSSLRYSVDELLRLRTSAPIVLLNIDKLSTDAETSTILNLPPQARENRKFCIRTNELAKLSKRAPLVERANNNSTRRRAGSRSLMASGFDGGNRSLTASAFDDEEEDVILYRGHPRRDIRQTEWQRRRRDPSERSSQPIDAPTDILAQKDDNFKAFFQAVRSPTHVRVTAGGRIVPNTRNHPPPQPVFKWNSEQRFFEPPAPDSPDDAQSEDGGVSIPLSERHFHGIFPAAGNSYMGVSPMAQAPGGAYDSNVSENTPMQPATNATPANHQPATGQQSIRISPPENFDASRPFWFHDRWVFPQEHGLPFNLPGNPGMMHPMYGYMPPGFAPHAGQPFMPFPPHAMMGGHPGMHHAGQQLQFAPYPPMMLPGPQPLANIANGAPAHQTAPGEPLIGAQPMQYSEDMKQRLARCRDDLKKIENELENAHQNDKSSKLGKRILCIAEIQRLEDLLSSDMTQQTMRATNTGKFSRVAARKSSSTVLRGDMTDSNIKKPVVVDGSSATSDPASHLAADRISQSTSQSVEMGDGSQAGASTDQDKSRNRARLAAVAATAVFQPRAQQVPNLQTGEQKGTKGSAAVAELKRSAAVTELSDPMAVNPVKNALDLASIDKSLVADKTSLEAWIPPAWMCNTVTMANVPQWQLGVPVGTGPPPEFFEAARLERRDHPRLRQTVSMNMAKTFPVPRNGGAPYMPARAQIPMAPRAQVPSQMAGTQMLMGPQASVPPQMAVAQLPMAPRVPVQFAGAPYLKAVTLPNGEYTYERQLTDDELRARCLYWGNCSRDLQRGLPKYNGKDFFPPSPAKGLTKPSHLLGGQAQTFDPFRDVDYRRTNQGLKEDGSDRDSISQHSWNHELNRMRSNKSLVSGHTLPKMKTAKREELGRFSDKAQGGLEEDQRTIASDRQSIGPEKRNTAENKGSSILATMLKNPRYNSHHDRKELSDAFSGNSQSLENRLSTPSAGPSMAAPSSGTITSATARGLLPQYRGTATASLAPKSESPERFGSRLFARFSSNSDAQDQQSPQRVRGRVDGDEENKPAPSRLAAAEYLQTLANREQRENQKLPAFPSHLQRDDKAMGRDF